MIIFSVAKKINTVKTESSLLTSPMSQQVKNLPEMQKTLEMQVQSLGGENPVEEEMATHCSLKNSMDRVACQAMTPKSHRVRCN